jgi:hypothetical protein
MITTLLLPSLLLPLGGGHAALHPADANIYLEIPNVGAVLDAYEQAPLVLMIEDPAMQGFVSKIIGRGPEEVTFAALTDRTIQNLEGQLSVFGVELLTIGMDVQQASLSISGFDVEGLIPILIAIEREPTVDAEERLRERLLELNATMVFDFDSQETAQDAHELLKDQLAELANEISPTLPPIIDVKAALKAADEASGTTVALEPASNLDEMRMYLGMTQVEKHITFRFSCDPLIADLEEVQVTLADNAAFMAAGKHLAGGAGATILNGYVNLESLDELHEVCGFIPDCPPVITAAAKAFLNTTFPDGAYLVRSSTRISSGQVIQESFQAQAATDPSECLFSTEPITRDSFRMVPPEAVAVWAANLNRDYLGSLVTEGMATLSGMEEEEVLSNLEAEFGLRPVQDLVNSLSGSAVGYTMPYTSIGLPKIFVALELDNPEAFTQGLHALGEAARELGGDRIQVSTRAYRKQPLTVFSPGPGLMRELFEGMGAAAPGFISLDAGIAVVEDRALFSVSKIFVKREIKRLLKADPNEHHAIMDQGLEFPSSIQSYGQTDWGSIMSGAYASVRGFLPLIMDSIDIRLPFDLEDMPPTDIFTRYFKPSTTWTREVEGGSYTYSKSSIGPELQFLIGVAVGSGVSVDARDNSPWEETTHVIAVETHSKNSATMQQLIAGIDLYHAEHGHFPSVLTDLEQATQNHPNGFIPGLVMPLHAEYSLHAENGYELQVHESKVLSEDHHHKQ